MALISPRIAQNLAKNGYYPTDDNTVKAIIGCFEHSDEPFRVLDPCIGEATAAMNLAYSINMNNQLYGVEYNEARAKIATKRCDKVLRSDLFDTVISPQSFGLLFLNPPYGDLTRENTGAIVNYQRDYKRLEKIFYRFTLPLLQYDGIIVLIIPYTQLDDEMSNWLASQFTDISLYSACDKQFRQIIILGKKVRQQDISLDKKNQVKAKFKQVFEGSLVPDEIGLRYQITYSVPKPKDAEIKSFYKLSFSPDEFDKEMENKPSMGLWGDKYAFTQRNAESKRQPLCQMSDWHLSLALASGEISGVVSSQTGKTYVIKGDTYKAKTKKVTINHDDDGNLIDTQTTLTDKFIPSIKAWDFTSTSEHFGELLIITSSASQELEVNKDEMEDDEQQKLNEKPNNQPNNIMYVENQKVNVGQVYTTPGVKHLIDNDIGKATLVHQVFNRYCLGDWGDMEESDKRLNDRALKHGQKEDRLFASYQIPEFGKIWIITEWHGEDKFITTILLPSEY